MKTPTLYFFMTMTAATFVPLVAHGQIVADGTGASNAAIKVDSSGERAPGQAPVSAVAEGSGNATVAAVTEKKEDSAEAKARKNAGGYGFAGASAQSGSRVPIGLAIQAGAVNQAMDFVAEVSPNTAPDLFRIDTRTQGLRFGTGNPYSLEKGMSFAVALDGHMGMGFGTRPVRDANGKEIDGQNKFEATGIFNYAATANLVVPFFCPKGGKGVARGGLGYGITYGDQIGAGFKNENKFEVLSHGPAAAIGGACQWENVMVSLSPYVISNQRKFIAGENNPTLVSGGLNAVVAWHFNEDIAAFGRMGSDYAIVNDNDTNKGLLQTTTFQVGAGGTFGHDDVVNRVPSQAQAPAQAPGAK